MVDILRPITTADNLIRLNDVVARIATIEGIMKCPHTGADVKDGYARELEALRDVPPQFVAGTSDNCLLIKATYFTEYAKQAAEDLISTDIDLEQWPFRHIDWYAAARYLGAAYATVIFNGVHYRVRYGGESE